MQVVPYKALGQVELGMTQKQVRERLASPFTHYMRAGIVPVDSFRALGLVVCYDSEMRCEAVEATIPARVEFGGYQLVGTNYSEAVAWLAQKDPQSEKYDEAAVSRAIGVSLDSYTPDTGESAEPEVGTVTVFVNGYCDRNSEGMVQAILKAHGFADPSEYTTWERFKWRLRRFLGC